jgi:hypothetical protein
MGRTDTALDAFYRRRADVKQSTFNKLCVIWQLDVTASATSDSAKMDVYQKRTLPLVA